MHVRGVQLRYTFPYAGRHKCPDPIQKGEFNSSYTADYPAYENFRPDGKYRMIEKNFILPNDSFQGQSSYTNEYTAKGGVRPAQHIPRGELTLSNDPFQGNSSYVDDYLAKGKGIRAEQMKLPKNFVMPEGAFNGDSSYHGDYVGGYAQRQPQIKPVSELKVGGNFEGVSSYGADFENKGSGIKAERVPLPKNHVMPEGRFEGTSNYTSNYVPGKAEKQPQYRPEGQLKVGGGGFDGASSYGADYSPKGKAVRAERTPLPKNQILPVGKFEGESSYAHNYVEGRAEKQPQFRPHGQIEVGGDFQGTSSYGADYNNKGSGLKAERVPLPRNHVMPQGAFEGHSVYADHYVPAKSDRQQQFRPEGELKIGGAFQGASSYGVDYDNKGSGLKAERVPLPKNHVMPEGHFEGNSTYVNAYTGAYNLHKVHFE